MPKECNKCHGPGTAGPNPHLPSVNLCVKCAAIERVQIPPSGERLDRLPASITNGIAWRLVEPFATGDAIWLHQARALGELDQDRNVVVATSTASGKTLVFQAWAMEILSRNPQATAIVFYPTKALGNDQRRRWQAACEMTGLPPETIGQIDGDIRVADRARIMANARVIIATPDVCHAWLLRTANEDGNHRFLRNLALVIIDEAHIYESVLGSNSAFFFRRLSAAVVMAGKESPPQYIAATATIQEPERHLEMLTGQPFSVIAEDLNGAPRYSRELLHVAYQPRGGAGETQVSELVVNIIDNDPSAQVIVFHDSRQGIERIVQRIGKPQQVLPYRSGYLAEDRRKIEDSLRENTIRAVISTSALELGIDMPDLNYGINLDLPVTRKQFHQRLGRVGRSQPGVFIIMAPSNRFRDYGETLRQYYDNSVEPSHMYLENEYVNFRQARCLRDELGRAGLDTRVPPGCIQWPVGFDAALQSTHGRAAPYLQKMEEATLNSPPQMAYSLRTAGEESLSIIAGGMQDEPGKSIGNINVREAMREAYPGAVYHHRGQSYRVESWGRNSQTHRPQMRVARIAGRPGRTDPIGRKIVIIPQGSNNVISRRELRQGYVAESRIIMLESVEGFSGNNGELDGMIFYREKSRQDPRMSRKQREVPTTGVHIRIREEWFSGDHGDPWQARHQIARAMRRHLAYQRSIALPDIGYQVDNIVMETPQGFLDLEDSIIVHDSIHGGMGLTHDLYENLEKYVRNLSAGTDEGEGGVYHQYIEEIARWAHEGLDAETGLQDREPGQADWWMVVRPGSEVLVYSESRQKMVLAEVTGCAWRDGVRYDVRTQDGETLEFRDGQLQSTSGGLDFQYWKPETGNHIEMSTEE